jgi:hypothetical protein
MKPLPYRGIRLGLGTGRKNFISNRDGEYEKAYPRYARIVYAHDCSTPLSFYLRNADKWIHISNLKSAHLLEVMREIGGFIQEFVWLLSDEEARMLLDLLDKEMLRRRNPKR